jgi:hypothetical protein
LRRGSRYRRVGIDEKYALLSEPYADEEAEAARREGG